MTDVSDERRLKRQQVIGVIITIAIVIFIKVFISVVPQRDVPPIEQNESDTFRISTGLNGLSDKCEPSVFDPNTSDSLTLLRNGIPQYIVHNIVRYRAKGGVFRQESDLRKIYGFTDSLFNRIRPFISIDSFYINKNTFVVRDHSRYRDSLYQRYKYYRDSLRCSDSLFWDSIRRENLPRIVKKDTVIELNSADTLSLQYLRGIGPYFAREIIRYRKQLGGYYSPEQIREISSLSSFDKSVRENEDAPLRARVSIDSILIHLTADADSLRPIDVNSASIEKLQRHPYLTFVQAKEIYEHRRSRVRLKSIEDIRTLPSITDRDIERLQPYLSFSQ